MAASEADMVINKHSATDMDGVTEQQFGTINYDAGLTAYPLTAGVATILREQPGTLTGQILSKYYDYINGAAGDDIRWLFFGDEITLVTGDIVLGGDTLTIKFLDHDGTWKVYSSITGFTITGTTTTLGAHAVSAKRYRWEMDLGFHMMMLEFTTGAATIELDSIEVGTPFHNHITKLPVTFDRLQPHCHGGMDVRPTTPFEHGLVPGFSQAFDLPVSMNRPGGIGVLAEAQEPFIFYSHGGMVELSVSVEVTDSGGGAVVQMAIDGVEDGPQLDVAAGATENIHLQRLACLSPGVHWAYIVTDGMGADTITNYSWHKRESVIPTSRVPSLGQAPAVYGPDGRLMTF
jgi:hypothetical protein